MAGPRQHYIPRFLQKGFASKTKRKAVYSYVFTRTKKPYETNLINIGLEKYFYGTPDDLEADQKITNDEYKYAEFVKELRGINQNTNIDPIKSSSLLGHLLIRAKYLRDSMNEIYSVFFERFHEILDEKKDPQNILTAFVSANKGMITDKIRKRLPEHLSDSQKKLFINYILNNYHKLPPELGQLFQKVIIDPLGAIPQKIPKTVKHYHNKVLKNDTVSNLFINKSKQFLWELFYFKDQNIILGDVCTFGKFEPDGICRSLLFFKSNLEQVFLPISSNHLLVGENKNIKTKLFNANEINEISASLSRNFFISSVKTNREIELSRVIGSNSSVVKDRNINWLENKIKNEFFGTKE